MFAQCLWRILTYSRSAGQAKFQISRQCPRLSGRRHPRLSRKRHNLSMSLSRPKRKVRKVPLAEVVNVKPTKRFASPVKESTFVEAAKGIVPTNTKQCNAWALRAFFRVLGYSTQRGYKPSFHPAYFQWTAKLHILFLHHSVNSSAVCCHNSFDNSFDNKLNFTGAVPYFPPQLI